MENQTNKIIRIVKSNNCDEVLQMLKAGLDPNFEGAWPLRLAARYGSYAVVKTLVQWGGNPHLPGKAGASTLQLAVHSGLHWEEGSWEFLLSCCDSSQLADGAAIAIVFKRLAALRQILKTGRCNTNVPTTLTGRTVESLARGYNLEHVLKEVPALAAREPLQSLSPAILHPRMGSSREGGAAAGAGAGAGGASSQSRSLSPSVAQFFEQTARQPALSPGRRTSSPQASHVHVHSSPLLLLLSPTTTILQ